MEDVTLRVEGIVTHLSEALCNGLPYALVKIRERSHIIFQSKNCSTINLEVEYTHEQSKLTTALSVIDAVLLHQGYPHLYEVTVRRGVTNNHLIDVTRVNDDESQLCEVFVDLCRKDPLDQVADSITHVRV